MYQTRVKILYTFIFLSLAGVLHCDCDLDDVLNGRSFFYFAYGSNLLSKRLHINNPSAVFYKIARLEGYRLDFNMTVASWQGAAATIIEDPRNLVWGVVWLMDKQEIRNLDKQEGVDRGWYFAKSVTVTTPDGEQIIARTYQEVGNYLEPKICGDLPPSRRPSNTYLQVIALGAIESHLPAHYIGFIFSFPTNQQMATPKIRQQLGYPF